MEEHVGAAGGDTDADAQDQGWTDPEGPGVTKGPIDDTDPGTPEPAGDDPQSLSESGARSASESQAPPRSTGSAPPPAGAGGEPRDEAHPPEPTDPMVSARAPEEEAVNDETPEGVGEFPEEEIGDGGRVASDSAPGRTGEQPSTIGNAPPIAGESPVEYDPPDTDDPETTPIGAFDSSPAGATAPAVDDEEGVTEPDQIETERPDIGTE